MRYGTSLILGSIFIVSVFTAGGCIDLKGLQVAYTVDKNLEGEMRLTAKNIYSTADTEEKQKRELAEFLAKELASTADSTALEYALSNTKTKITRKTELDADVVLTGRFNHLIQALIPLAKDYDFIFQRKGSTLTIQFAADLAEEEKVEMPFVIKYSGTILSTNAHSVDKATGTMQWYLTKLNKEGIRFVLSLSDAKQNSTKETRQVK